MFLLVELYGWHTVMTPELLVVAAGLALLYAKAGNIQPSREGVYTVIPWSRQALFYAGILCFYFGYGGFLSVLAKESIDFYVLQLCIRYLCMIPLFLAGMPVWIRDGLLSKLPGESRVMRNDRYGLFAELVFFLLLSVLLLPIVFNALLKIVILRFMVHIILLASAWLMWEYFFRAEHSRRLGKNRKILLVLGSILLFPICLVMAGSDAVAYSYPQHILCISQPVGAIQYGIVSKSAFGGMMLMAAQQLSFILAILMSRKGTGSS
ncbi:cytochrome c oxidase assembly protein [Paenibacillus dokdonensis]|uniref:Cytochrome c oxidase assembly protein n=1 Tax=Paenibacillus dokdonensis TaxID=2567944 RepID=A0ABU6GK99_9BACL|nr:cytochrome c oxidase assembly protein [Paenibacillus dokdonensis]MEC0239834.1 cytochrome c oxidase assembly protein [Paenibacillus dokdonensis]